MPHNNKPEYDEKPVGLFEERTLSIIYGPIFKNCE